MKDAEKLVAWLREAATELEKAHRVLDDENVPREAANGVTYSLAARIVVLAEPERSEK